MMSWLIVKTYRRLAVGRALQRYGGVVLWLALVWWQSVVSNWWWTTSPTLPIAQVYSSPSKFNQLELALWCIILKNRLEPHSKCCSTPRELISTLNESQQTNLLRHYALTPKRINKVGSKFNAHFTTYECNCVRVGLWEKKIQRQDTLRQIDAQSYIAQNVHIHYMYKTQ